MSLEDKAKMATLEELTEMFKSEGIDGMAMIAMSMNSLSAIALYQTKFDEIAGDFSGLLKALEDGGFVDENGGELTSTLTFQNLKKRLIKEEE